MTDKSEGDEPKVIKVGIYDDDDDDDVMLIMRHTDLRSALGPKGQRPR